MSLEWHLFAMPLWKVQFYKDIIVKAVAMAPIWTGQISQHCIQNINILPFIPMSLEFLPHWISIYIYIYIYVYSKILLVLFLCPWNSPCLICHSRISCSGEVLYS